MAIKEVTAINRMTPFGEKNVGAVLEYEEAIDAASLSIDAYEVRHRTITGVHAEDTFGGRQGHYVVLDLDPDAKGAETRRMVGFGPNTRTRVTGARLSVVQRRALRTIDGTPVHRTICGTRNTTQVDPDLAGYQHMVFRTADDHRLAYHLFVPAGSGEGQDPAYPLVLFMADSSVVSEDSTAALIQGLGGVIWALPEEQERRPCYVLVPAYQQKTADDDYTVTWECEATVQLLQEVLERYPIDRSRVYGTGQSMGCMMLYEMMSTHPDLFAAGFMVAGQWDPARIATLGDQRLWILISERDEKAFPVITESVRLLEERGVRVARGHVHAQADAQTLQQFADEVLAQGAGIQFTWYEGDSNLPAGIKPFPGCYHLFTWRWAYGIEPIRAWLFAQSRNA